MIGRIVFVGAVVAVLWKIFVWLGYLTFELDLVSVICYVVAVFIGFSLLNDYIDAREHR